MALRPPVLKLPTWKNFASLASLAEKIHSQRPLVRNNNQVQKEALKFLYNEHLVSKADKS
jgi:hypothetical protein